MAGRKNRQLGDCIYRQNKNMSNTSALEIVAPAKCADIVGNDEKALGRSVGVTPIFIITHNRLTVLKQCIASIENSLVGTKFEIVIHDNQSTYEPLIDFLKESRYTVYWNPGNNLDDVAKSVAAYFEENENAAPFYAVTDPDIEFDVDSIPGDWLDVYQRLLDETPHVTAVGPELRIDDIPDHYPLKQELLRRHRFGHKDDKLFDFALSDEKDGEHSEKVIKCVYRPVDTTFALYRRGFVFHRLNPAVLCHAPYNARHLDWYIDGDNMNEDDRLYMMKTTQWGHWSSTLLKRKMEELQK